MCIYFTQRLVIAILHLQYINFFRYFNENAYLFKSKILILKNMLETSVGNLGCPNKTYLPEIFGFEPSK